jgi:opacity protein-like surface antigen
MIRALLVVSLLAPVVAASAQEPVPPAPQQPPAEAGPGRQVKGYFGWQTDGGTDFVLGAEFVKYQGRRIGLAGFAELIFADDFRFALGATAQWHTRGRLYLETGPGLSINGGTEFFWRVGGGWEISPVGLVITPKLYLDFIEGETLLGYGLSIGRKF